MLFYRKLASIKQELVILGTRKITLSLYNYLIHTLRCKNSVIVILPSMHHRYIYSKRPPGNMYLCNYGLFVLVITCFWGWYRRLIFSQIHPKIMWLLVNHMEREIRNFQPMQCLPILIMTCFLFRLISSHSGWFQTSGWFHEKNPMFIKRRQVDFTQPCDYNRYVPVV